MPLAGALRREQLGSTEKQPTINFLHARTSLSAGARATETRFHLPMKPKFRLQQCPVRPCLQGCARSRFLYIVPQGFHLRDYPQRPILPSQVTVTNV